VKELTDTEPCSTRLVLERFKSQPAVPTDPSKTADVPSDLSARNHAAVPVALISLSAVRAFAVATPAAAAPKAVALKRS
jgi:hypothetical protein